MCMEGSGGEVRWCAGRGGEGQGGECEGEVTCSEIIYRDVQNRKVTNCDVHQPPFYDVGLKQQFH